MLTLRGGVYTVNDYQQMQRAIEAALVNHMDSCECSDCQSCNNRVVCDDLTRLCVHCKRKVHELSTEP